jgi:hypothetical protein
MVNIQPRVYKSFGLALTDHGVVSRGLPG